MEQTTFAEELRIVKAFVIGALGLAMVLGSSTVSSAAEINPKVRQVSAQCQCTCWYGASAAPGGYELGVLTFRPPKPNSCSGFTSFDRYFVCKDAAGRDQAGVGYAGCKYTPGITAVPADRTLNRAP